MAQFVDMAALVGFACEAVLYGINLVVYFLALTVLVPRLRRYGTNKIISVLSAVLFLSCTAHFALEFNHFYVTLKSTGVDGYANETSVYFVADIFISVTDFFGDLILIYRCWRVWDGNFYVIILPTLTSIGGLIAASEVGHLVHIESGVGATPSPSIVPLGLASFTLPFCTNVLVTALIAARIWWASRKARAYATDAGSRARTLVLVVVESGALYFCVQLVFVTLYGMNIPAEQVIVPMAVQVYGIASFLIVIQAGLGLSYEHRSNDMDEPTTVTTWGRLLHPLQSTASPPPAPESVYDVTKTTNGNDIELRPMGSTV